MRKIILLVLSILLLTGCVRTDLNVEEYDKLVLNVFENNVLYTNEVGSGYKFYIPKGIRMIENDHNNQVFVGVDTKIYMYVDITSYYYKNSLNYSAIGESFYFKELQNDGKTGFIQLVKTEDDEYFVKIVYNYAKIECYTSGYNLNKIITLSTILLNSVEYNDVIIKNLLDDNSNSGREITYNIDKPENADSDFSQYLEEFITEEEADTSGEKLPDEYDY